MSADLAFQTRRLGLHFAERRLLLALGDLLAVNACALISNLGWSMRSGDRFGAEYLIAQFPWFLLLSGAWFIGGVLFGLYDVRLASRRLRTTQRVVVLAVVHSILYLALFFALPPSTLPRFFFLTYILLALLTVSAWRWLYISIFMLPYFRRRAIVVGAGWAGDTICRVLTRDNCGYEVVALLDDNRGKANTYVHNVPVLGTIDKLPRLCRDLSIDEAILAITGEVPYPVFEALSNCQEQGVTITRMAEVYEQVTGRVPVEHAGSAWLVDSVGQSPLHMMSYRALRRTLDIMAAVLVSLISLPILPVVVGAIVITSRGPVLYRQTRVGRGGRHFEVLKFRSMKVDAESDGIARWATRQDPRVTSVGRFLRKLRIDELPQLINVFRGEMSLVGPRPERPPIVADLQEKIPYYRARLLVKPGLTGWAQVNYEYGNSVEDALIKLEYDLYYIKHQSIWLDLLVLARTIGVVLGSRGI